MNAPVEVAAVSIRALVAERGVELVKKIPVCRMNFYAVKPGFFYAQRGFGKLFATACMSSAVISRTGFSLLRAYSGCAVTLALIAG